jgi:hypothetical protein
LTDVEKELEEVKTNNVRRVKAPKASSLLLASFE